MFFHVTLSQGRSDSTILESSSQNDVIQFYKLVSTAVLSSIKKIVYSKDLDINYSNPIVNIEDTYSQLLVFCKSKTQAKVVNLYNVKKTIKEKEILASIKTLTINGEKIEDVYNIQFIE